MESVTPGRQDGEEGPETPRSNLGLENQNVMVLCVIRLDCNRNSCHECPAFNSQ